MCKTGCFLNVLIPLFAKSISRSRDFPEVGLSGSSSAPVGPTQTLEIALDFFVGRCLSLTLMFEKDR